jgi:small subunit ribosomal protein S3
MGQKVNPTGIRLGITQKHTSTWYADKGRYAEYLNADMKARDFIRQKFAAAGISRVQIERPAKNAGINITAARPGVILGKKGGDVENLRKELSDMLGMPVHVSIEEVKKPDLDARLVAESIAQQLERRVMFRKAMKRAVQSAQKAGALGVKINVSGRLGGAEIARSEWNREGRVPLHTFRADIDYGLAEAKTTYGIIGVKVWIFKGEVFKKGDKGLDVLEQERDKEKEKEKARERGAMRERGAKRRSN